MKTKTSWRNVGQKIRSLRKEHQLTIKQLAKGCDLSPNAISLIERGEVAPTVATLCKVANALGAPIDSFFQEVCPEGVVLTRSPHPAVSSLGFNRPGSQTMQNLTCAISSPNDTATGDHQTDFSATAEVVVCLSGQLECEMSGQRYHLNPGDNLSLNGRATTRWRNRSAGPTVAMIFLPGQPHSTITREGE